MYMVTHTYVHVRERDAGSIVVGQIVAKWREQLFSSTSLAKPAGAAAAIAAHVQRWVYTLVHARTPCPA